MTTSDAREVEEQYATTDRLRTRAAVWRPAPGTVGARDAFVAAAVAPRPHRLVDVGCGDGVLTAAMAAALRDGAEVVGVGLSSAMVAATEARGITAVQAAADALPFDDDSQDVVTSGWMLYHVPDVDAAVAELARVVRPGGTVVVATNGAAHLHDLYQAAGAPPVSVAFAAEDGDEVLSRHFSQVSGTEHPSLAHFETRDDAVAYLATLPWIDPGTLTLPDEGWPRDFHGSASVFVCRP